MTVDTIVGILAAFINVLVIFILTGINRRLERIEDRIYSGATLQTQTREVVHELH